MKKVSVFSCGLLIVVSLLTAPVMASTITGITLQGGNTPSGAWEWNGQGWSTDIPNWYVLGVSSTEGGTLVNNPDKTISVSFGPEYWLYATQTFLGSTPKVTVETDNRTFTTIFTLSGANGSGEPWTYLQGDTELQLGWASQSADKVDRWTQTQGGGVDYSLHLQTVPEPATLTLLTLGSLAVLRKRRRNRA